MSMRRPSIAAAFALYALLYVVASCVFYWDGFFRYWSNGPEVWTTDVALPITGRPDHYSVVPFSRFVVFAATMGALVWCARAMFRGDPRARLVGFLLCFGWLAPQARYLAAYLHDFQSFGLASAWSAAAAMVIVPAALLSNPSVVKSFAPHEQKLAWASLPYGKGRLVGLGVALAWLFYGADLYLAAWPWIPSNAGLVFGVCSAFLSITSFVGLVNLKTWAIFGALLSALFAGGFLIAARAIGLENGAIEAGSWIAWGPSMLLALVPVAIVSALTWPLLAAMGRVTTRGY